MHVVDSVASGFFRQVYHEDQRSFTLSFKSGFSLFLFLTDKAHFMCIVAIWIYLMLASNTMSAHLSGQLYRSAKVFFLSSKAEIQSAG